MAIDPERARSLMSGESNRPGDAAARAALSAASWGYAGLLRFRNALYRHGVLRSVALPRTTISVGNLTTGGTGKTPMVVELARRLIELGHKPAVLLRGYAPPGSANQPGSADEVLLLREELGETVPVEADADRVAAAARVIAARPDVTVFLLDDGFQHRRVKRNLDLVLIDAAEPFGFGHVLPRGMLREPASGLRRATAVIVTRADQSAKLADLDARIARLHGRPPIAHAAHAWSGLVRDDGSEHPLGTLRGRTVTAACGIGNPAAFERSLRDQGPVIASFNAFPDHARYSPEQLAMLFDDARQRRAEAVVITAKDWVKWRPILRGLDEQGRPRVPVYHVKLRIRFLDGEAALDALLSSHPAGVSPAEPG